MNGSVIVWDLETGPDLRGFAVANDLVGKTDEEIREAVGDKFPKHIYHLIVCIGALVARQKMYKRIVRGLIIATLILSAVVSNSVVFADSFDDSIVAYDRGDYATAVRLLRPLAEQGDAKAQNALGAMYYNGKGVARDFKEAFKWYRSAAAQGNISAQVNLASMYYEGEGVAVDLIRSHMWLSITAARGNADATRMRDIVSKGMTAQQLVEARAMAAKCELSGYKQCD